MYCPDEIFSTGNFGDEWVVDDQKFTSGNWQILGQLIRTSSRAKSQGRFGVRELGSTGEMSRYMLGNVKYILLLFNKFQTFTIKDFQKFIWAYKK